jgi:hypothetical protein
MAVRAAKSTLCKSAKSRVPMLSSSLLTFPLGYFRKFRADYFEGPGHFFEKDGKLDFEYRLLRVNHNIDRDGKDRTPLPDCVAHAALDAIALDGSS